MRFFFLWGGFTSLYLAGVQHHHLTQSCLLAVLGGALNAAGHIAYRAGK